MSINKYKPHLYVIPEDDAERQIADGFILHSRVDQRQVQVVAPAGGWKKVLDTFTDEYVPHLTQHENAHVVMLVDFDEKGDVRRKSFEEEIPLQFRNRVFVIGPSIEPEDLKQALRLGGFENIGQALADDCDRNTFDLWRNEQLKHNEGELKRLVDTVKPFLFT